MDRIEEVYLLFEGGCPHEDCQLDGGISKDTRVTGIGGTRTFMKLHDVNYPYHVTKHYFQWDNDDPEVTDDSPAFDDDGYVDFMCDAGHGYQVFRSRRTGEWG